VRWSRSHWRPLTLVASLFLAVMLLGASWLALRDPYSVRQYQAGRAYLAQAQYDLAIKSLDKALAANPDYRDAWIARARAHLRQENYPLAMEDFLRANRLKRDGRPDAVIGFCLSRMRYHAPAILHAEEAIRRGFGTAKVYNNLAFAHLQLDGIDAAEKNYRRALELDETLPEARDGLLVVLVRRLQNGGRVTLPTLEAARRAADLGPPSVDLYWHLGIIYTFAAQQDPLLATRAVAYLEKAVELGCDPKSFDSSAFSTLERLPRFQKLLSQSPGREAPLHLFHTVDPWPGP
jgi:tetratricopeptide (TPR) repeat protein